MDLKPGKNSLKNKDGLHGPGKERHIRKYMAKQKKGVTPMDAALSYLTARARTVGEMELYLYKQQFGEVEVYDCVERLKELGYLNDEQFAADFIATRLSTKPVSRRKLREQLYSHKLEAEVIQEALEAVTDAVEEENAAQVAAKFWRQFEGLEEYERKVRVIRRLLGRGYDMGLARAKVEAVIGDLEEIPMEQWEAEECATKP